MSWRQWALDVIWPLVRAGQAAGDAPEAILARIDAAYPFGARAYHPYAVWLKARKEARRALGLLREEPGEPRDLGMFGDGGVRGG